MLKHDLDAITSEYVAGDSLATIGDRRGVTREGVRRVIATVANFDELRARHDAAREARRGHRPDRREHRRWHGVTPRASARVYSDDELLEALRGWHARHGEPVSVYRWNETHDADFPSSSVFPQRFGTWNTAKRAAGLVAEPERRQYARRWDRAALVAAVLEYLGTLNDVANASWDGYTGWAGASGQAGRVPSGHTVRKNGGNWLRVLKPALYQYHAARGS